MGPFYLFPTQQYGSCALLPPSEEGQLAKKAPPTLPVGACMTLPPPPSRGREEGGPARLHDGKALSLSFSLPSSMPLSAAATPFLAEGRAKAISASTVTLAFAVRGKGGFWEENSDGDCISD